MVNNQLPNNPLKNQKGTAIMIALTSIMLITAVVIEISSESLQERIFSANKLDRAKSYYAAKSALEFSLFRVYVYKVAQEKYGSSMPKPGILEMIWQMPFAWPPTLGEDASLIAKSEFKELKKASWQDIPWTSSISSEGAKLDLNELNSPSDTLKEATKKQLQQLIQNRLDADDDWSRENRDKDAEEIVNNIMDWVDRDSDGRNGSSEDSVYQDRDLPDDSIIPPNRDFRTLDELMLIEGIDSVLYKTIASQSTVFGVKGININEASAEILRSLNPELTEEHVKDIIERRNDETLGPFTKETFESFMNGLGFSPEAFNPYKIPLIFDKELNFRIQAIGVTDRVTKQITVVTYDYTNAKTRLSEFLEEEEKKENPEPEENQSTTQSNEANNQSNTANKTEEEKNKEKEKEKTPKVDIGRPQIVFWEEN